MTMTKNKVTKKDNFNAIVNILVDAGKDELADVMRHEIELLNKKADKAKTAAAEKKANGDALAAAVEAVLTDELCTIADIAEKVEFDGEVSTARIQYRLNALVKAGKATKEQISVGEGESKRKLMAYKCA